MKDEAQESPSRHKVRLNGNRTMSLRERHTKALRKKAGRGFSGYPVATVAYYGPDDKIATKVAVGIVAGDDQDPIAMERWFSDGADLRSDHEVNEKIMVFIREQGAKSVVITDRIIGCPHEERIDYPEGEKCPPCSFWENRNRWSGEIQH